MDFVSDALFDGRRLRVLMVVSYTVEAVHARRVRWRGQADDGFGR